MKKDRSSKQNTGPLPDVYLPILCTSKVWENLISTLKNLLQAFNPKELIFEITFKITKKREFIEVL